MISHLLFIKCFDKKNFLKNKGFPYQIFRYCEKIKFRQNCDTPSLANFLIQKFSETQDSPYEIIQYCETKKFREKVVISHFYPQKVFDRRLFLKNEGFSYENFRYCWENHFSTKSWYTIFCIFFKPEIFRNKRVPLRNFSVLWENQFSTKSWYTILCNFFKPESFWKTRVPLRSFLVLWDKKTSRESRDISLLSKKFFDKRNFLKNEGFPYKIFRYCEKINFRQNCDTPSYAIFLNQKFSETQASSYYFFKYCETKSFERKSWSPPPSHKKFR